MYWVREIPMTKITFHRASAPLSRITAACRAPLALVTLACGAPTFADVPNGTCTTATSVSSNQIVPVGLASAAPDDLASSCGKGPAFHTCWYAFTPETSGVLTVSLAPTGSFQVDPLLVAYAACNPNAFLDCSSFSATCGSCAQLTINASAGNTYYVCAALANAITNPAVTLVLGVDFSSAACGNEQSCCLGHFAPSCSDATCCDAVCTSDPMCCTETWDAVCAAIAGDLCNELCTQEDCDGNGEIDAQQFGAFSHVAVPTSASTASASDWCPPLNLKPQKGVAPLFVSTGMPPAGLARFVTIPYQGTAVGRGLRVVDTRTVLSADDGSALLSLGQFGLRVSSDESTSPSSLVVSNVSIFSNGPIILGEISDNPKQPQTRVGALSTQPGTSLSSGDLQIINGACDLDGTTAYIDQITVGVRGSLVIRGSSYCNSTNTAQIAGELHLDGGFLSVSQAPRVAVGSPTALLTGSGALFGSSVAWSGVVAPQGDISVSSDFRFTNPQGLPATDAKLIIQLGNGSSLTAAGSVDLHGTLVIDATNFDPSLGQVYPFLSCNGFFSDAFDSVQFRGLPPNLGAFVVKLQGNQLAGATSTGLGVVFVPLAQVIQFGTPTSSPLPARPTDAVRGDFNADGIEDLAITLSVGPSESGSVVVFEGTGNGLTQVLLVPVGKDPRAIAAADFNGDERLDLVVANFSDGSIQVLRNQTTGPINFNALTPVGVGNGPVDVAVGDFLPDALFVGTRTDVVVALQTDESFKVVKNNGGEINGEGSQTVSSDGGPPTSVGGGDVDNDRDDDVVGGSSGGTTIIPGGTSSSFTGGPIFIATPNAVTDLKVADFNGDGIPEIVSTLLALAPRPVPPGGPVIYDSVALIRATGPGFSAALLDFWLEAQAPAVGDFDGDGDFDFALTSRNSLNSPKRARIIRNDSTPGNPEFNLVAVLPELGEPDVLVAISIDGIGDDILSAEQVTQGDVAGRITLLRTANPSEFGDLNGDGAVGAADLALMFQYWGLPGIGDLDRDGVTNGFDLTLLLGAWSKN